jgi:hypothetical protein
MNDEASRPKLAAIPLPPERAFVVQLRSQNEPGGEIFIGRVEHITSGAAASFDSADGLIGFIAKIGGTAQMAER